MSQGEGGVGRFTSSKLSVPEGKRVVQVIILCSSGSGLVQCGLFDSKLNNCLIVKGIVCE